MKRGAAPSRPGANNDNITGMHGTVTLPHAPKRQKRPLQRTSASTWNRRIAGSLGKRTRKVALPPGGMTCGTGSTVVLVSTCPDPSKAFTCTRSCWVAAVPSLCSLPSTNRLCRSALSVLVMPVMTTRGTANAGSVSSLNGRAGWAVGKEDGDGGTARGGGARGAHATPQKRGNRSQARRTTSNLAREERHTGVRRVTVLLVRSLLHLTPRSTPQHAAERVHESTPRSFACSLQE